YLFSRLRACCENGWRGRLAPDSESGRPADRNFREQRCEKPAPIGSGYRSGSVRRVACATAKPILAQIVPAQHAREEFLREVVRVGGIISFTPDVGVQGWPITPA